MVRLSALIKGCTSVHFTGVLLTVTVMDCWAGVTPAPYFPRTSAKPVLSDALLWLQVSGSESAI